ncbi:unnamed protein product [Camellia sinensis]
MVLTMRRWLLQQLLLEWGLTKFGSILPRSWLIWAGWEISRLQTVVMLLLQKNTVTFAKLKKRTSDKTGLQDVWNEYFELSSQILVGCDVCVNGPPEMLNLKAEADVYACYCHSLYSYDSVISVSNKEQRFMEKPNIRMFVGRIREQNRRGENRLPEEKEIKQWLERELMVKREDKKKRRNKRTSTAPPHLPGLRGSFLGVALKTTLPTTQNKQRNKQRDDLDLYTESTHILKNIIEKVSGEDESEDKEAQIIEKFRALLGSKSFKSKTQTPSDNEHGFNDMWNRFDEEIIESLFGYDLQSSTKNNEAKSKSPSPSKHFLEPKRLQNKTILSKAVNVTAEQICDALIQGSKNYIFLRGITLSLQQLEALVKMEPTKEEAAKLTNYKGNINELGSAEQFVKAMLSIPLAFSRIEAMLYRETFEEEVVHLRKSFSMLEEACKELRSSRLFLKLLEAVLKTGHRMNVGTIQGGAKAFKLDALLKLADVKGTDGRTTLLHFVVQDIVHKNVEEREEDYRRMGLDLVLGLSIELCNVKKTATIDLDVLASSVSNLSDGMTKLKHLIIKDLCVDEKSANFVKSMRSFLGYVENNLKELREDERRVLLHVREITEYFHGDVSKEEANPLRIFVIVRDFLGMLGHVCKKT